MISLSLEKGNGNLDFLSPRQYHLTCGADYVSPLGNQCVPWF